MILQLRAAIYSLLALATFCSMDSAMLGEGDGIERLDAHAVVDAAEVEDVEMEDPVPVAELLPVSDAGLVFLDKDPAGAWWITHAKTQERYQLCGEGWELTTNPETGRSIVYQVDEFECVVGSHAVDSLLKTELCQRSDNLDLILVDLYYGQRQLELLNTKYREGALDVKVGATAGSLKLTCYVFQRSRACGVRIFVDMKSMYNALQLTQHGGVPSKWVYGCSGRWLKQVKPFLGELNLVYGTDNAAQADFQNKCLPFAAGSLPFSIMMLMIWSAAPKNKGGFDCANHRRAAQELLSALCAAAVENVPPGSKVVEFDLDPGYSCLWPRPQPPGNYISVVMDIRGIEITAFAPSNPMGESTQATLWKKCGLAYFTERFNPIADFVSQLVSQNLAVSKPIVAQLAWHVAVALEHQSLMQVTGKFVPISPTSKLNSTFNFTKLEDSFANRYKLAKACASYVQCTRSCRSDWQNILMSTDKGDGGQLPLQQSVLSFPDNMLFVALPQAAYVVRGQAIDSRCKVS